MNINDVINIVRRVHDAEGMDFGSRSTRESRNAAWARLIGIVHFGHPVFNTTPDPQWCIKDAGGGRPQSDDVVVSMPSREAWDCIPGAGTDNYSFGAHGIGRLSSEQNVYAPPRPADGGVEEPPPPPPPPPPGGRAKEALKSFHGTYLTSKPGGLVGGDGTGTGREQRVHIAIDESAEVPRSRGWIENAAGENLLTNDDGNVTFGRTDDQSRKYFGLYWQPDNKLSIQSTKTQKWLRMGSDVEGFWVHFNGPLPQFEGDTNNEPGDYEKFTVEAVAGEQPGPNPTPGQIRPMNGRLRVHGDYAAFGDDSGPRADMYVLHMGDAIARWMYGKLRNDQGQIDECLRDLDDAKEAGPALPLIRTWWYLDYHPAGSVWHSHKYDGIHHDRIGRENFVRWGIEYVQEVAARGMRVCLGPGGVGESPGELTHSEEAEMFGLYRQIADGAGWHNIAWVEGVNEASSGGTSDEHDETGGTRDNSPENLSRLVRIVTDGTGILGHLSYWTNNDYREAARYLASWQHYNYNHSWRGGNMFSKIDRHFTWCRVFVEQTGRENGRLTMDGEGPGAPTSPGVPGDRLTMVSATENGHEMDNAEGLALTVVAHNVRGIGCLMSGNGVRRYQRFTNVVGWREVPWILSKLPPNLHEWTLRHGGMNDARQFLDATRNGGGVLGRADQAVSPDGRFFLSLIYNEQPDQHQSYPFRKSARFTCFDTGRMSESQHEVNGGGRFDLDMYWGRVLLGEAK